MNEMAEKGESLLCQFCWRGSEVENISGQLHAEKMESGKVISAHHRCMQYASGLTQYKCEMFGGFDIKAVEKEISRGKKLRCSVCKGSKGKQCRGASCGCAVKHCRKTFHFTCASTDPVTVTKRLVVTKNKNNPEEKTVMYRVFCSPDHEATFRKLLKSELRGITRKKQRGRSLENSAEGEAETETNETSDTAHSDGEMLITSSGIEGSPKLLGYSGNKLDCEIDVTSPVTNRSIGEPKLLAESPLPVSSTGLSSIVIEKDTDNEAEIVSTETSDERNTSQKDDSIESSPSVINSSQQGKIRLTSGAAQGVKADVSQPLLCRLTEELKSINQGMEEVVGSQVGEKTEERIDVLDTQNCRSNGADFITSSPGEGSLENLSPNIPLETPKSSVKGIKVLSDSLVNVENGLVLQSHTERSSQNCRTTVEVCPTKRSLSCKKTVNSGQLSSSKSRHVTTLSHADNSSSQTTPQSDISQELVVAYTKPTELEENCNKNRDLSYGKSNVDKSSSEASGITKSSVSTEPDLETPKDGVKKVSARKRKRSEQEQAAGPYAELHKEAVEALSKLQPEEPECVLLIPSNMEQFQAQDSQVMQTACKVLKVAVDHVFVWQNVTMRSLPSQLLLFFMLDMVKELQRGNSEGVLDLLFDGDCLSSRVNNYLITQGQVFDAVNDEKAQQDIVSAMWSGLEQGVKCLPVLKFIRVNKDLAVIAFDVRIFDLGSQIIANMQAYRGLFGWSPGMEAVAFPLSPSKQRRAIQTETLALKVWLTKINPITDVVVLPSDDLLLEKNKCPAHEEFFKLADYLKEKTQLPIVVEDAGGNPVHRFLVPLLVFQPVQVFLLSFQEYFQRACEKFFQTRGIVSGLALVPLSNLFNSGYKSISSLLRSGSDSKDAYTVSVYSSFCPAKHPTTMVLLEISYQPQLDSMLQTAETPTQSETEKLKRKRGRPKKFLPD